MPQFKTYQVTENSDESVTVFCSLLFNAKTAIFIHVHLRLASIRMSHMPQ